MHEGGSRDEAVNDGQRCSGPLCECRQNCPMIRDGLGHGKQAGCERDFQLSLPLLQSGAAFAHRQKLNTAPNFSEGQDARENGFLGRRLKPEVYALIWALGARTRTEGWCRAKSPSQVNIARIILLPFPIQPGTREGWLGEKIVEALARRARRCGRNGGLDRVFFAQGLDGQLDQLINGVNVAALDFFTHQPLGLGLNLHRHSFTLSVCGGPRNRVMIGG
jgi:hypothetical protein